MFGRIVALVLLAALSCSTARAEDPSTTESLNAGNSAADVKADPGAGASEATTEEAAPIPTQENPMVILRTDKGDIEIELFADKAPDTVANFLRYVDDGFYNGTIFHRVIRDFMIQGGGFTADMQQKQTRSPVKNEAANGLQNARGTVAMARTQDPHSATAQFFINTVDNGFLNFQSPDVRGYGYCVFGRVVKGLDVVDAIRGVRTGNRGGFQDVPVEAVAIREAVRATAR